MRVLKVIVDEMPERCAGCQFQIGSNINVPFDKRQFYHCFAIMPPKQLSRQSMTQTRPDWCPLMTMRRLLKLWEYAETGNWDYEAGDK